MDKNMTRAKKAVELNSHRITPEQVDQATAEDLRITVKPLRQRQASFRLVGTSPLMVLRFSVKRKRKMMDTHEAGSQARSKKIREARNFEADFEESKYKLPDGSCGLNAAGLRRGLIEVCRLAGFKMIMAKMSVFVEADGYDDDDNTPLIRIQGTPEMSVMPVRNASGVIDLRSRPVWREWKIDPVRIRWDLDQFSATDIFHLLQRVGAQNGLGEGRPNGKESAGMGFGLFDVELLD